MAPDAWYTIVNIESIDSPSLVLYPDRIKENIRIATAMIDDVARLRPHIKTNKSIEVCRLMLEAGIRKFKCATIAEAEMLAEAGAPDVLLAYQPVGPKVERLLSLVKTFPAMTWSCLIDNFSSAKTISDLFHNAGHILNVCFDLNVGMDRTGIVPKEALRLFEDCSALKGLTITGLHAYDGHIRDKDFNVREKKCNEVFSSVKNLRQEILKKYNRNLTIIAGGTPTFSVHCKRKEKDIECSPGTFIYWDKGYEELLPEQRFLHAALVITRVISIPAENIICTDLGHKAIAAENPLPHRVYFLNAPEIEPIGHSEEHMTLRTTAEKKYNVGDVLYGLPYHICPTVALHDDACVVENRMVKKTWTTTARKRKIRI